MASALIRVHPALAALAAGISSLALIRTFERIDRSLAAGLPMRSSGVVWTFVASMAVATTILDGLAASRVLLAPGLLSQLVHGQRT